MRLYEKWIFLIDAGFNYRRDQSVHLVVVLESCSDVKCRCCAANTAVRLRHSASVRFVLYPSLPDDWQRSTSGHFWPGVLDSNNSAIGQIDQLGVQIRGRARPSR
jgi:hypothetical protein